MDYIVISDMAHLYTLKYCDVCKNKKNNYVL